MAIPRDKLPNLRKIRVPGSAAAIGHADDLVVGKALVELLRVDIIFLRTSEIRRGRRGGFAVNISLTPPPSSLFESVSLAGVLTAGAYNGLSDEDARAAGIPVDPPGIAEAGYLLNELFRVADSGYEIPASGRPHPDDAATRQVLSVILDHRPRAEKRMRYRVVFAAPNDAIRADSLLEALRMGLGSLHGRAQAWDLTPAIGPKA